MAWFCWHRWSRWEVVREGPVGQRVDGLLRAIGYFKTQERTCAKCGKLQMREVWQ